MKLLLTSCQSPKVRRCAEQALSISERRRPAFEFLALLDAGVLVMTVTFDQPMLKALLIPLGSAGGVQLIDYFTLMK